MSAERVRAHRMSLRARATSWYVGLLAIALVVFSIGIYGGVRSYLKQSLQRGLSGTANTLVSEFLTKLPAKGEPWVLGEVRESYAASASDHFVRLSVDGRVLYQTADMREPAIRLSELALPQAAAATGAFHRQKANGEAVLIYSQAFAAPDNRVFQVEAGTSLYAMTQTLRWLAKVLVVSTIVILVFAIAGGYFLMERALRPLATLTGNAANIGRKRLGERLPVIRTGDELERLTHSLNSMIDRLEEALDHNHRFSADASHELRTPLTIMRGELEEMLRIEGLPAEAVANLGSSLEEIDRMSRIVNSLMTITRLDAGGERMDLRAIDLSTLAETTTEHLKLLADEKGLPIECQCEPGVIVFGDAMRLKQVIVNLVDNAIKYTPASGSRSGSAKDGATGLVRVAVSASSGRAQLEVADEGIGISDEALPYVFDRFYRADFARSRGEGGVGLGLAIVKAIVAAHEGNVSIHSSGHRGSVVTVELPLINEAQTTLRCEPRTDAAGVRKQARLQSV